jgi:radical SAM superfamily enzyme YgiQ (UPF0313 family)
VNVLLIHPEFPDTFWSFKHAMRFIRKQASLPPLGLVTVAALLPREWKKRLVDTNVHRLQNRDLEWADLVLVGAMTVQRRSVKEILARCQAVGVRTVAGGPLFTAEPEEFPEVDHLVLNEAELTLPPFLEDLARGKARRVYASEEYADMSQSPVPLWELIDLDRYASTSIQYTRGCPYQCEFCNVTALLGHRPRWKTPEQILAELEVLHAQGWRDGVFFVDDNFIGNRRQLQRELLPALTRWRQGKRRIRFQTEASINLADDEGLALQMVEAGFDTVFVGIETPDDASLLGCGKTHNQGRDMLADIKRLQRWGLQVQGGFIVGFDGDTESIFQRQLDFIQESGIVTAMVGILQALPGTRLHERMRQEGRLVGTVSGDNVDGTTNITPTMGLETLSRGYRQLLDGLYSPGQYYARLRTFLREYRSHQALVLPSVSDLMAFLRSHYRLGFLGQERFHYWKLMLWTLLRRPRLLGLAIELAICGHHYRRVCELHVR